MNSKAGKQQHTPFFLQLTLLIMQHTAMHIYPAHGVVYADAAQDKQRGLGSWGSFCWLLQPFLRQHLLYIAFGQSRIRTKSEA